MMFADQEEALCGQIVRLESGLAAKEIQSIFIRFPWAVGEYPRKVERFAAALSITGSVFQFDEEWIRTVDCIS